jgi:hypothetical protein
MMPSSSGCSCRYWHVDDQQHTDQQAADEDETADELFVHELPPILDARYEAGLASQTLDKYKTRWSTLNSKKDLFTNTIGSPSYEVYLLPRGTITMGSSPKALAWRTHHFPERGTLTPAFSRQGRWNRDSIGRRKLLVVRSW